MYHAPAAAQCRREQRLGERSGRAKQGGFRLQELDEARSAWGWVVACGRDRRWRRGRSGTMNRNQRGPARHRDSEHHALVRSTRTKYIRVGTRRPTGAPWTRSPWARPSRLVPQGPPASSVAGVGPVATARPSEPRGTCKPPLRRPACTCTRAGPTSIVIGASGVPARAPTRGARQAPRPTTGPVAPRPNVTAPTRLGASSPEPLTAQHQGPNSAAWSASLCPVPCPA